MHILFAFIAFSTTTRDQPCTLSRSQFTSISNI